MIYGIFHRGSGVGNQLHRYVATRVLAKDKKFDFTMVAPELCKVKDFMELDMGADIQTPYQVEEPAGKVVPIIQSRMNMTGWEERTQHYNPEFNFVPDNSVIDGEFQAEQYFTHRMDDIDEWLAVEPLDVPDDLCVIGFRGGEFYLFPELGLPKDYFDKGIRMMQDIRPLMRFEVHTDDPELAKTFFPAFKIVHDVAYNWRSMRFARYSIVANSSFYILPRLLKHNDTRRAVTIAPRGWARRNLGEWSRPDNYYKAFKYI